MVSKNNRDLHTNGGEGETSYARNSTLQRKMIILSNSITEEAVAKCIPNTKTLKNMEIADLGCSSGPNSFMVISNIVNTIETICSHMEIPFPELRVSLNDLPGNDFNNIFKSLPEFYDRMKREKGIERCFVSCVGGSFHGRLFPAKSLHLVYSSSSLHWLSQVPEEIGSLNKGKIYISKTSPVLVAEAYLRQFQKDFYIFLRSRAAEMAASGQMVLTLYGRSATEASPAENSSLMWEFLAKAFMSLASDGLVENEKIDAFNLPFYHASPKELKNVVKEEGSFVINHAEECKVPWGERCDFQVEKMWSCEKVAKILRAAMEPMLESAFGNEVMDELFLRFGKVVDDYFSTAAIYHGVVLIVSLSLMRSE